jgi:hypothetical protein
MAESRAAVEALLPVESLARLRWQPNCRRRSTRSTVCGSCSSSTKWATSLQRIDAPKLKRPRRRRNDFNSVDRKRKQSSCRAEATDSDRPALDKRIRHSVEAQPPTDLRAGMRTPKPLSAKQIPSGTAQRSITGCVWLELRSSLALQPRARPGLPSDLRSALRQPSRPAADPKGPRRELPCRS